MTRMATPTDLDLAPLRLRPRLVEKPWGGRRLGDLGRNLPPNVLIGESWDVADLDASMTTLSDPVSRVATGPHEGASLADLIALDSPALLGEARPTVGGRFPLLVKHLDARENLSVQVHPPAEIADRDPGVHLKTESWVVVAAESGARLLLGVADGVSADDIEAALGNPALVPLLRAVPARVGDVHHLSAGLIHALGAGVVVAEVQTPSDTTYRMYDWTVEYGRAERELHRAEAMASARAQWHLNTEWVAPVSGDGLVVESDFYTIQRHRAAADDMVEVPARRTPRVLIVVQGKLTLPTATDPSDALGPGGVLLLPAAWAGELALGRGIVWLDVDLVATNR